MESLLVPPTTARSAAPSNAGVSATSPGAVPHQSLRQLPNHDEGAGAGQEDMAPSQLQRGSTCLACRRWVAVPGVGVEYRRIVVGGLYSLG
jgi:hypothetical protein